MALGTLALVLSTPATVSAAENSGVVRKVSPGQSLSAALKASSAGDTVTLAAIADTYASSGATATNYGKNIRLDVDGSPGKVSYLKFDLSPYAGRTVTNATLELRATSSGSIGKQNIKLVTNDSWTETGLTYKNRPAVTSTVLGTMGPTTRNTSYTVPLSSAGVSGQLGAQLSLGLDSSSRDGVDLASRETGSTGPRLRLVLEGTTGTTSPGTTVDAPTAPATTSPSSLPTGAVTAAVETVTLSGTSGDVADDPAVWVDPSAPGRSVVIGTNKSGTGGGIAVYDLSGKLLQFRRDGKFNNVDLRTGMTVGGTSTVVVTASNRTTNSLVFYRFNTTTRQLEPITARHISTGFEPYGLCMYNSARTGRFYAFVTQNKGGATDQYELFDSNGKVDARKVRSLSVGSISEGCVADDELGHLYIAQEDKAIWKYGAEPTSGSTRTAIGTVGDGHLVADVEGLAIAAKPGGGGHLIASSQGNNSYAVYERTTGKWVRSFKIAGTGTVDGTSQTDGLAVATGDLGSAFPNGLLVVHDNDNTGSTSSNYKLVDLGQVLGR